MTASTPYLPQPAGPPPEHFGRYRILRHLAQGGMGSVYLAHDTHLERPVALKVPHFRPEDGPDALQRFYREARLAATLHHPNICPVYDVGQIDGFHCPTMAYLQGQTLAAFLQDRPLLPERQAAALVRTLAAALEEAHGQRVVHRDLKPSNVMLTPRGQPVLMDFGLARNINQEGTRLTRSGAVLGTPAYRAPEQVRGDAGGGGPGCDIYSLGVILYELLAGRTPFEGPAAAVLGKILVEEPPPPSAHRPDLTPELDAVCRKAIAKQAADRYATMAEFAAALDAYLQPEAASAERPSRGPETRTPSPAGSLGAGAGLPTLTDPASGPRTGGKSPEKAPGGAAPLRPSRRPWGWVAAAVVAGAAGGGLVAFLARLPPGKTDGPGDALPAAGALRLALQPPDAEVEVAIDGDAVDPARLAAPLSLSPGPHEVRATGGEYESVNKTFTVEKGENPALTLQLMRQGGKVAEEGRFVGHTGEINALAVSPNGKTLLTGSEDDTARMWDAKTGKCLTVLEHADPVRSVAFSPDGKAVATTTSYMGQLWDAATGRPIGPTLEGAGGRVVFSADGKSAAALTSSPRLWEAATGNPVGPPLEQDYALTVAALSPDGKTILATSYEDPQLWDAATGRRIGRTFVHKGRVNAVAFSPDGKTVATCGDDHTARLFVTATGEAIGSALNHEGEVTGVAFSPDGKSLATCSKDSTARLWEAATGRGVGQTLHHSGAVRAVAFSRDGKAVATGSDDRTARLWEAATGKLLVSPLPHGASVEQVAFSPDGRTLATRSGNRVWLWSCNPSDPGPLYQRRGAAKAFAFGPDGKTFLTGSREGIVRVWAVPD
jgi:WD40 repeat protein/serine/threonine protein kinase